MTRFSQILGGIEEAGPTVAAPFCPRCGGQHLVRRTVSSVFWQGSDPVLIRGIPSLTCEQCHEDFIDDSTAQRLEQMKAAGFQAAHAETMVQVPAFRFDTKVVSRSVKAG